LNPEISKLKQEYMECVAKRMEVSWMPLIICDLLYDI
jgi:hypothetical protein